MAVLEFGYANEKTVHMGYGRPEDKGTGLFGEGDMWQERIVRLATFEALANVIGDRRTVG